MTTAAQLANLIAVNTALTTAINLSKAVLDQTVTQVTVSKEDAAASAAAAVKAVADAQGVAQGSGAADVALYYEPVTQWPSLPNSIARLLLTGNTTMANATGLKRGNYTLVVDRDNSASREIAWSSGYWWKDGLPPSGVGGANTRSIYEFMSDGVRLYNTFNVQGIPLQVPAAPANLRTNGATSTAMTLAWDAEPTATGYNLYRNDIKVNTVPLTSAFYTDINLNPATYYAWKVSAISSLGEGATSTVANGTTLASTASGTINGITVMPDKVRGIYFEIYDYAPSYTMLDVPLEYNIIYAFNIQPIGPPNAQGKQDNVGDGTFGTTEITDGHITRAHVQGCRARGQKVILTAGGEGAGFNFSTRQRSINFITSFKAIAAQLGGVDGIDWNTFEAYLRETYQTNPASVATNTTEMVWISQQLRDHYGPNFAVTIPPGPNAFGPSAWSPYDAIIAKALNDAGLLSYSAPQFYDTSSVKTVGNVSGYIAKWVDYLGASKVVVGLSHGNKQGNFSNCLTREESDREVTTILARDPGLRGFFLWSMHDKMNSSVGAWLASTMAKFNAVNVTPVQQSDAPVVNAFAHSGGQNGAWLDFKPSYLRQGTTAESAVVTASGQLVGRIMDRSTNGNDAWSAVGGTESGTYLTSGAFADIGFNTRLRSTTGGGSGEGTNTSGFYLATILEPRSYYYTAWDDIGAVNSGRSLRYDSDEGGIVFSVGTGSARVDLMATGLATLYETPPVGSKWLVEAWHEGTTIYLRVNGGATLSAACPAFLKGSTDYVLSAGVGRLSGSVHMLSPLTATLRDGIKTYMTALKP